MAGEKHLQSFVHQRCIYTPTGYPSNLLLNVYLESAGGIYPETPIDLKANVYTNDANSAPSQLMVSSIANIPTIYPIPSTVPSGSFNVIFQNTQTNTNITVPITINPAATSSSAMTATAAVVPAAVFSPEPSSSIASNSSKL